MVVCLYNNAPLTYLREDLDGRNTIQRTVDYVLGLATLVEEDELRIVLYSTEEVDHPDSWEYRRGPALTQAALTELLAELADPGGQAPILFGFFDEPFLNLELTQRLLARHKVFRAEYTFCDGYPTGLGPEVLSPGAVVHLRALASATERVGRDGVFPIVAKDINRLDVETELSRVDQRLLRLELAVNTRPNLVLCKRLADGAPVAIDDWPDHVAALRGEHRTLPRFVSIQVVEQEVQSLSYSPYPAMRDEATAPGALMSADQFQGLVARVAEFSPEAVVHLSLWGEIALHPEVDALLESVLATERLGLLVETSGVGWSEQAAEALLGRRSDRLTVIVGLDSNDPDTYARVRGDGYEEAHRFAERAVVALGERTYVQAVRCDLTEPSLDAFYREWKERTDRIIIEKYDHFAGRLPDRKVGDISPLNRFPCWHLQRDLYVLADGSVPVCREDISRDHVCGNVFAQDLESIWDAGRTRFAAHVDGHYEDICEACDEYYTFAF